jgi:hypothetical protein
MREGVAAMERSAKEGKGEEPEREVQKNTPKCSSNYRNDTIK